MQVALVSFNPRVGDVETNVEKMLTHIEAAARQGCQLIVFPEMSLIGYPPKDLLFFDSLYASQAQALIKLKRASKKITIVVGGFVKNSHTGAPFHNVAFLLQNGQKEVYHKQLLPNYDVFDEQRYFEPGSASLTFKMGRHKFGITICEDIWAKDPKLGKRYNQNPVEDYRDKNIDVLINISASPFEINKSHRREKLITQVAHDTKATVLYVNQSGANDDLIFDGALVAVNAQGTILLRSHSFNEELLICNLTEKQNSQTALPHLSCMAEVAQALVTGIRDFFHKSGFQKAILGLSGGIDSALVAQLACIALGPENVTGVMLPSRYSSKDSLMDAQTLAQNLKMPTRLVPIDALHQIYESTLNAIFTPAPLNDITAQNVQARIRGNLLMAIANNTNSLLLNTTNKSEMAFGYGTLYGDMCGALAVISDLTKNQVYALAKHLNPHFEFIPESSLTKAPSAELKPNQKDSDSLPEYPVLDQFIGEFIENFQTHPQNQKWQNTVMQNEHKRFQAPLGLKINEKAFGSGRRMPIVQKMS